MGTFHYFLVQLGLFLDKFLFGGWANMSNLDWDYSGEFFTDFSPITFLCILLTLVLGIFLLVVAFKAFIGFIKYLIQ